MTQASYRLRFWGVRGSVPTPVPENMRYGGNTSCVAASLPGDEHLILDAGTGLRLFGNALEGDRRSLPPMRFHVFLTHYHFDHIEGLPFFAPLYARESTFVFHGFASPEGRTVREILEGLIAPPHFPVRLAEMPSRREFVTLDGGDITVRDIRVATQRLNHPNGAHAYQLEHAGRRIVYATDHEHGDEATDAGLARFASGADHLVYDAQYVPTEYEQLRRGWGHSTWYAGVQLARRAKVGSLVLFHHHPMHADHEIDAVVSEARKEFEPVLAAREGLELEL